MTCMLVLHLRVYPATFFRYYYMTRKEKCQPGNSTIYIGLIFKFLRQLPVQDVGTPHADSKSKMVDGMTD